MIKKNYENTDDLKQIILVETLDEIKDLINEHSNTSLWFRGVSRADYRLVPKVIRNAVAIKDQFGRPVSERHIGANNNGDQYLFPNFMRMLDIFKQVVSEEKSLCATTDFDWLFIAQHYGLPTPLLDWTEDFKIALWFATENMASMKSFSTIQDEDSVLFDTNDVRRYELSNDFAAVYIMDPYVINSYSTDFENVVGPVNIDKHYDKMIQYLKPVGQPYSPLCILGKNIDIRLRNQKGNFSIHGANIWELDHYTVFRKSIIKVLIPAELRNDINCYLNSLGIDKTFIYNGFDPKEYAAKAIGISEDERFKHEVKIIKNK